MSKLAEVLDLQSIIHVRGTPASGKSVLSLLLRDYYRKNERTAFWLGTWCRYLGDEDPWEDFAQVLRQKYPTLKQKQKKDIFTAGSLVIIDEAQGSYGDIAFWNNIVKDIRGGLRYRIKLCLFASYGSPSTGTPYNDKSYRTPVDFAPTQRVSLTPSFEPGSPPIGLFYTEDEFEAVVTRLCSYDRLVERYIVDEDARNYLFGLTNGHPGAVKSIVSYLFEVRNIILEMCSTCCILTVMRVLPFDCRRQRALHINMLDPF